MCDSVAMKDDRDRRTGSGPVGGPPRTPKYRVTQLRQKIVGNQQMKIIIYNYRT